MLCMYLPNQISFLQPQDIGITESDAQDNFESNTREPIKPCRHDNQATPLSCNVTITYSILQIILTHASRTFALCSHHQHMTRLLMSHAVCGDYMWW